jgi:hypothetical protein
MGKSKKAPGYATATYNTGGLFGSSTASKNGVDFNPTDTMTSTGNTAWAGVENSLQGINSNDYSQDPNFQVYQDNFNRGMQQAYETNVLNNLTNRGLMRSSGLQSATNSFNNTMQQGLSDLYDSYYNRQSNNLSNNMNVLSQLYNFLTGVNTGAQNQANSVSNYNLQQTQLNNQANAYNNALYASLANSLKA